MWFVYRGIIVGGFFSVLVGCFVRGGINVNVVLSCYDIWRISV